MIKESTMAHCGGLIGMPSLAVLILSIASFGCGSSEPTTEWETTPTVSTTAQLEFRVDSLKNENRHMQEQVDATAAENRTLTAKVAELETKLADATAAPKVVAPADMSAAYEAALGQWRKKNFTGAIDQFQGLLNSGIDVRLAGNCHYWIGESYFGLKQYNDAIQHFQKVLEYKHSPKKDYAQYMLGNCYQQMGDKASAKDAFDKVVSTFPASPLVKKAQDKLARLK